MTRDRRCREKIVNDGPPREIGNLLAATRTMAEMRYNDINLLRLPEEIPMTMKKVYNASPFIQRLRAESQRGNSSLVIIRRLTKRFGAVPQDLTIRLAGITDETQLLELVDLAYECESLDRFLAAIS